MPWDVIKLNDGTSIPNIAFGTWTLGGGQQSTDKVDQAISVGFNHIGTRLVLIITRGIAEPCIQTFWFFLRTKDTAQAYRNEREAGVAIRESGLDRSDFYITTKYSGLNGLDIETSIKNSLENVCHIPLFATRLLI